MRIFLLTSVPLNPPWDQGDKNLAYELTTHLTDHRFVALTNRSLPTPNDDNLELSPVFRNGHPTLREKAEIYWWLLRKKSASDPDLFHFLYRPYPFSTFLNRLLPAFKRRPILHTVPATGAGQRLTRHHFLADRIVALTESGRQALTKAGLKGVQVIPPGISQTRWREIGERSDAYKTKLGLVGRPVLLYPGHFSPGYGASTLLDALPQIVTENPGVMVIFACRIRSDADWEYELAARRFVRERGLEDNACFFQTVPDMGALVGASDMTVLPLQTMRDKVDIPTSLLESLAASKPIVITDLLPMAELLHRSNGEVGKAVRPGDANALAAAINDLLKDAPARHGMGLRGQQMIGDQFDIRQVSRQYEKLYVDLICSHPSSS